ncbi:hypothetical protein AGMMS50276_06840 [Synergistales bacterium]|nr:hypothetical protein AGMMS50276_06840 [Synergistales bacterium]
MNEIQRSVGEFHNHLKMIEKALKQFTEETRQEEEKRVSEPIKLAVARFELKKDSKLSKAVDKMMKDNFDNVRNTFDDWMRENNKRSNVKKALKESAEGLIVAVFGRTNAGKSTLGNFIRGKTLRKAPFPTPYNPQDESEPITFSKIRVIERAGEEINASKNAGFDWFKVGATETTKEAQIFTGHGMTWMDTPGFGSNNDEKLGGLAAKYVEQADLILYLDFSDSPGLREHAEKLKPFMTKQRKVCLVITRSDKYENKYDENGKVIFDSNNKKVQDHVGKAEQDREAQQNQELKALRDVGCDTKACDAQAISISTLLANEGIEENDERKYKESNIDLFFQQFKRVMPDEETVRKLKRNGPTVAMIQFINLILTGDEKLPSLSSLIGDLDAKIDNLKKLSDELKIDDEAGKVARATVADVNNVVWEQTEGAVRDSKEDAIPIDVDRINDAIAKALYKRTNERAARLLKDFFVEGDASGFNASAKLNTVSLNRVTETHEYEVTETESYVRDPNGIWENVCSFFGKTYRGRRMIKVKKQNVVDLGYNSAEIAKQILDDAQKLAFESAKEELANIKERCLEAVIKTFEDGKDALGNTRGELENFMKELDARC